MLEWLESQVRDGETLLPQFSIADISVASHLLGLSMAGETIAAARHPKLAAYLERTLARPSFQAVLS